MNARHARLISAVLALLVGIAGGLLWGNASAQLMTPRAVTSASQTILNIPIAGTTLGDAETVDLSGRAQLRSVLVTDPDFGGPASVIVSIDLLDVHGVGQLTGARFLASSVRNEVVRLLRASDLVEMTFPVFPAVPVGPQATSALPRPVLASFTLNFDANGQLQRASAKLSPSPFQVNQ